MPGMTRRPLVDSEGQETAAAQGQQRRIDVSGLLQRIGSFFISSAHADDQVTGVAPSAPATQVDPLRVGGEQGTPTPALDAAATEVAPRPVRPDWDLGRENANATDAHHDEIERVEGLLDAGRRDLATRAAADPTGQAAQDFATQQTVDAQHQRFASVDMGNGVLAPTPYMINLNGGTWRSRKASRARTLLHGTDESGQPLVDAEALSWAQLGKASAGQNRQVLQAIVRNRLWEQLGPQERARFDAALAAVLPPAASDEVRAAASAVAYAEIAGLGTDCSGYVQHVLVHTGALPAALANEVSTMTSANTLTSGMGVASSTRVGRTAIPSPLDANGAVSVRPGDTVRIAHGEHIGVVHDVVESGDEVIVRYSHSTPNQDVHQGNTNLATRTEGVRLDIITFNKTTQRWTSVRGAFSSNDLNTGTLNGFYHLDRARVESYASGWMGTRDPWSVEPDREIHAQLDTGTRLA
jgi:hypothetical protein